MLPKLADGITRLSKPFHVATKFFKVCGRKEFRRILRRAAKRFQEALCHEDGDFVWRESQIPSCLCGIQPPRKCFEIQELLFIGIHGQHRTRGASNRLCCRSLLRQRKRHLAKLLRFLVESHYGLFAPLWAVKDSKSVDSDVLSVDYR